MDSLREEKVKRFEEFVDRRLKPDLVHAIAERDKVFEQQKVFCYLTRSTTCSLDLKKNIDNLEKNGVTSLRTMVNLGSEVYMQADVYVFDISFPGASRRCFHLPDTRHIFVDIGLGFHVEFTWSEALEFISVKEARLARYTQFTFDKCVTLLNPNDIRVLEPWRARMPTKQLAIDPTS
ncbi:hypothetical protein HHK36_015401 [Tetracentron sinense]|uniref:Uncharacterized protein n=1 Tax=Tetracentron sinense TaxID=13715 RepID=A0A834Z0T9_TETSI|nr:hypothetical protein HHK36_015401 [Tetracentron sinense]